MAIRAKLFAYAAAAAVVVAFVASAASQAQSPGEGPRYTSDGKLDFPKDYRNWIFLSSGMDMSYSRGSAPPTAHLFDNVFVGREAYAAFQKTGTWPDKTVFVLEVRNGQGKGSINEGGQYQTTRAGYEAHVKDAARFKDTGGWAFFNGAGNLIPAKAGCIACHDAHGAVDSTFVQFYPTLLPIAQEKKTLAANYLKSEAELARAAVK